MPISIPLVSLWLGFAATHHIPHIIAVEKRQAPDEEWHRDYDVFPNTYIDPKCTEQQIGIIKSAWYDSKLLADAQTNQQGGYDYNVPHSMWLGKDWVRWDNSHSNAAAATNRHTFAIWQNFENLKKLYAGTPTSGGNFQILWYCDDIYNACDGSTHAYYNNQQLASEDLEIHSTIFCDRFFAAESLGVQMERHKDNPRERLIIDNYETSTAVTMLHEVYHYKHLVAYPSTKDDAYHAQKCYDLAHDQGTPGVYRNADSYALDALAIYLQRHWQTVIPPAPQEWIDDYMPASDPDWENMKRFEHDGRDSVAGN
ncbi:Metalloproteases (zincins), catalytic [Glarea lozoyensis ATCC 20868]|uniref:Metalloproteases (Zincins), catalytic n=1 Tax=Glarea lozoyensis (strain ATCC 20868 / MF5171) TaxID=1116229 RepID=S3DW76_GLAL2|nr:Metalloproteases (zincins), catalytic [Glarea lozoyensis ATCC 20868]EPE30643.1 Metalloproteases (zincins), catalytic [Glarea lozoyensis ATCC 20868]